MAAGDGRLATGSLQLFLCDRARYVDVPDHVVAIRPGR
jgi:hypothetical protein